MRIHRQEMRLAYAIAYFGCDGPWAMVEARAARRRNTAMVEALAHNKSVAVVLVFNYVLRPQLIRPLWTSLFKTRNKVNDIFITNVFPERWGPFWQRVNRRLMALMIRWQAGTLNRFERVVWSYWPQGFEVACRAGLKGIRVFDADHELVHDENQSAGKLAEIETVLAGIVQNVDLVVAASRKALQWFEDRGARRVFRLRNGVAPARIQECGIPASTRRTRPRIGYVGVLSNWVDYELLQELVVARPDWQFVIGGAAYRAALPSGLARMKNVEWIGEVLPENLSGALATFDVALGLNRREPWLDGDSMKLFDYLAAGVPVVTTRFHDHLDADFAGLLEFGESAAEFVSHIEMILARDGDARRSWDARRLQFVRQNTWEARANEALGFLMKLPASAM